ncbi:MAG TPA: MopE-related protein [Kofleriaceae bacterium]|nr:MopE-related protein [Kofleriaceae bacterium]
MTVLVSACGGDDDGGGPLFEEKPECEGEAIAPLDGQHQMVISYIEIGEEEDGIDLDRDGMPDNRLWGVGSLAQDAIEDSFRSFDVIAPMEFFDVDETPVADDCVKLGVYLGKYNMDADEDETETAAQGGDCNDHDEDIKPGAAEVASNGTDDDCDGLADEDGETPSDDTADGDEDGVTIADGDCDDTRAEVDGTEEICGDGLDNDCDGAADFVVGEEDPFCTPYDTETPDELALDATAFDSNGDPIIAFRSAELVDEDGALVLHAGPSLFSINFPLFEGVVLDLRLTGATLRAEMVMTPGGWALVNGQLGGVIDANSADKVRGLEVPEIDLNPEDSLLDAIYANALGVILALPLPPPDREIGNCHQPDIDVDGDGLETFCDSDNQDDVLVVDTCIDGDGTIITDEGGTQCTEAVDDDGNLRFVDGISVELNFETAPAVLLGPLP